MQISMSTRRGAAFAHFFVSSTGILTINVAQNCGFVIPRKVYFIKFKLFSSRKGTKKFECWPRPVHPLSLQKVIPPCNSPFTHDFLLCVTSSLSIHPCFCRPSVCKSISLSVFLPSVSRTVRPLKLLVYLPFRLLEFMLLCWNVGFTIIVCLLARTSVFPY